MDGEGWDVAGIRAAYEQELESICTAIRIAKARTIAAAVSDRAAALRLQLDELDELDARQASQRMQHSIYRAMLSDVPILDQQAPSSAGQRGQAVSGKIPRHGYENVRVNSNGSTQLKEYIDHLRSAEEPPKQCYACMEAKQCLQGVTLDGCDHFWCHKCLRRRFNLATKNEGSYPVRCCMQLPNIPMDNPAVAAVLGNKLIIDLKAKIIEYETLDRTYCYKQTCSTFIPPDQILERMAPCPACNRKTCAECKARYHKSPNCTTVNDEAFDEWRTETRAATCPGCNHVIVISYGCNHMRCLCGTEFCYECSVIGKQCTCSRWQENRLLDRAAELAERRGDARANVVQQTAEALRTEGDCRHNDWTRVRISTDNPDRTCADCTWCARRSKGLLWQCDGCGMRACSRCRDDYQNFDWIVDDDDGDSDEDCEP